MLITPSHIDQMISTIQADRSASIKAGFDPELMSKLFAVVNGLTALKSLIEQKRVTITINQENK